jgi:hypothetical protein
VQSGPITPYCEFDPAHGNVYSIQHYVIKFVSDLQQVSGFVFASDMRIYGQNMAIQNPE